MNVFEEGVLDAIEAIAVEYGIEKAIEAIDTKLVATTPIEKAALAILRSALLEYGVSAYTVAREWLLSVARSGKPASWPGPNSVSARELSDVLVALQETERGELRKLEKAASVAANIAKPFLSVLIASLIA